MLKLCFSQHSAKVCTMLTGSLLNVLQCTLQHFKSQQVRAVYTQLVFQKKLFSYFLTSILTKTSVAIFLIIYILWHIFVRLFGAISGWAAQLAPQADMWNYYVYWTHMTTFSSICTLMLCLQIHAQQKSTDILVAVCQNWPHNLGTQTKNTKQEKGNNQKKMTVKSSNEEKKLKNGKRKHDA